MALKAHILNLTLYILFPSCSRMAFFLVIKQSRLSPTSMPLQLFPGHSSHSPVHCWHSLVSQISTQMLVITAKRPSLTTVCGMASVLPCHLHCHIHYDTTLFVTFIMHGINKNDLVHLFTLSSKGSSLRNLFVLFSARLIIILARFRFPRHEGTVLQPSRKMRPLTEEETRVMFEKIAKYIGENLQLLVDRPDGTYCFRLHNDRVYYVSEKILKLAANVSGDKLLSLGTCFGKFTKTHKFRLHITALDYLAPYAKYKVWIKPGAEQSFLYGNHVLKSGLGRITENTSQYQGVVVYSMADIPLGFGVAAKSTQDCRKVDPMAIVVFHQADIGEYVRHEETLT